MGGGHQDHGGENVLGSNRMIGQIEGFTLDMCSLSRALRRPLSMNAGMEVESRGYPKDKDSPPLVFVSFKLWVGIILPRERDT